MRTDELVEVSQDCEFCHELVVACVGPQPPYYAPLTRSRHMALYKCVFTDCHFL